MGRILAVRSGFLLDLALVNWKDYLQVGKKGD